MRSAKDLKEIVSSVRTKSNLNGIAGTPQDLLNATADTEEANEYGGGNDNKSALRKEYNKLLKEHDTLKR
jgi:hypothetical protein